MTARRRATARERGTFAAASRDEILTERREVIGRGVALGVAGALAATASGSLAALGATTKDLVYNGTYDVVFSNSSATSAWHNNKADQKMHADDFPRLGLGAIGKIPEIGMNVIIAYMVPSKVAPTMRGLVPYKDGVFAAFNAKCKHVGCKAEWRSEAEGESLVPILNLNHDIVVCGCHLSTYDIYDSARVLKSPATVPLDQLRMKIAADGQIQIEFSNYKYDRFGRGKQV